MGRYTGPINRISRRLGISILETGKEFSKGKKRKTRPGQHGNKSHKKLSGYGLQLVEKQKLRYMYGLSEKQLRNVATKAQNMKGSSSLNLLTLIESRLDNLVYRMGMVTTRRAARQLVNHGHIILNGIKNDIPSTLVKIGSTIELKPASKDLLPVKTALKEINSTLPFVTFDKNKCVGTYIRLPERSEISQDFNEALIIEFYNR